jgi:hypothetical protein
MVSVIVSTRRVAAWLSQADDNDGACFANADDPVKDAVNGYSETSQTSCKASDRAKQNSSVP